MNPIAPASAETMREYYARRASGYERIYHKPERQADLRVLEALLGERLEGRRVLEIACGTGWWTAHGAARCNTWLATDLNPQTMALARCKPYPEGRVRFEQHDAYALHTLGARTFDAAFAGFWWSHVPLQRLSGWLHDLHRRLEPGARVLFLDNNLVPGSSTPISRRDECGNSYQLRTLDDGTRHEVLKNFPTREQALAAIGPGTHPIEWTALQHYWLLDYRLS